VKEVPEGRRDPFPRISYADGDSNGGKHGVSQMKSYKYGRGRPQETEHRRLTVHCLPAKIPVAIEDWGLIGLGEQHLT
jgi:hypothetical protein